jgi:hypothetical protein
MIAMRLTAGNQYGWRVSAVLIALAIGLAGCIVSKGALFDPATAVTPLHAGSYLRQEYVVGNWLTKETGALGIEGKTYVWTTNPDSDVPILGRKFTIHDIGGGLFAGMAEASDSDDQYDHGYDLIEPEKNGLLQYDVRCDSVMRLLVPGLTQSTHLYCLVTGTSNLNAVLRAYAKRSFPKYRYVLIEKEK